MSSFLFSLVFGGFGIYRFIFITSIRGSEVRD